MKFLKKCIVFLISIFLFGCGNTTSTTSSETSREEPPITSSWKEPEAAVLKEALGEYYDIPFFEASTFYSKNLDNNGLTLAVINCFDDFNEANAETIYTLKLRENGYEITDAREEESCFYGIRMIKENELAVVMQYAYREEYRNLQRYSYFAIVCYLYQNTQPVNPTYSSFPKAEVYGFLGQDIPSYDEASSYEVVNDITIYNQPTIDIYCHQAQDDAETKYADTLIKAGYSISKLGDVQIATIEGSDINIWFYMSYDNIFFIRAYHSDAQAS